MLVANWSSFCHETCSSHFDRLKQYDFEHVYELARVMKMLHKCCLQPTNMFAHRVISWFHCGGFAWVLFLPGSWFEVLNGFNRMFLIARF